METPDGQDLAPNSAKAKAILALLATSPRHERARLWLQNMLWSDRGPEQSASSLRQGLFEIRKALGKYADILISDRTWVRLDATRIKIHSPKTTVAESFLEGLDVRDPEFERWVMAQRKMATHDVTGPAAAPGMTDPRNKVYIPPTVWIGSAEPQQQELQWAEYLFIDCVARTLSENFSVNVIVGSAADADQATLQIEVRYHHLKPGILGLRATLQERQTKRQLWSVFRGIPARGAPPADDPDLAQVANMLVDAVGQAIGLPRLNDSTKTDPNHLCRAAIRKMFSMRALDVMEADRLLDLAFQLEPKAIFLALRSQVRTIQRAETHGLDQQELQESADAFARQAMEIDPFNSMVLSSAANARLYINKDVIGSLDLATRGVKLNFANPFAWWSLSAARLYAGEAETSYQMAALARRITSLSPHGYWWDMQKAAAALVSGRIDESLHHFELAHSQCPDFRPPMRYLTALYAMNGEPERALQIAAKLEAAEPSFSILRLASDREYPASLLWKAEKVNLASLSDLL